MRLSIFLVLVALTVATSTTAQSISYDKRQVRLYSYALWLWRAEEPNLIDNCVDSQNTIRLTKNVFLNGAEIVRISFDDERVRVVRSVVPQQGNVSSKSFDVGIEIWEKVFSALSASEYWSLEDEEDVWRPHSTRLLIEACINKEYHGVQRYSERANQLQTIVHKLDALPNDT